MMSVMHKTYYVFQGFELHKLNYTLALVTAAQMSQKSIWIDTTLGSVISL